MTAPAKHTPPADVVLRAAASDLYAALDSCLHDLRLAHPLCVRLKWYENALAKAEGYAESLPGAERQS